MVESYYGFRIALLFLILAANAFFAAAEVSLLTARCLGSCGLAPAAVFDGEVVGKLTPEAVSVRVRKWVGHDA